MNIDRLVKECHDRIPSEWKKTPWTFLNHGYDALDSEDKLNAYISAYGEMHVVKCRKAMQNFPFDELWIKDSNGEPTSIIKNFEIFDWGCGQGIGILTFLELLNEREMLHGVSAITLIEPSSFALNRAKSWVSQSVKPSTVINTLERYIPSNNNNKWEDLSCEQKIAIHIFSNVLDVRSVGLKWLAENSLLLAEKSYYICVGPKYGRGISRIEDFYNLLGRPSIFSSFSQFPCGYTSTTNHPFGIEVKGFSLSKTNGLDLSYQEQSTQDLIDEYQAGDECLEDIVARDVKEAYHNLKISVSGSSELYFKPAIGIERPDFIYAHISNGIVIINVCSDIENFEKDFDKVDAIKSVLFDIYIKSLKISSIINPKIYNSIKIGLYFPSHITQNQIDIAKEKYYNNLLERKNYNRNGTNYKPKDPTQFLITLTPQSCSNILRTLKASGFSFNFYQEIKNIILGHWHYYSDGDLTFKLTKRQEELLKNINNRLRIKGVAGCGKTHLIAYFAVKEHLRTGNRVLIITYNIALIKYIQMRINQVPADFSTDVFDIINYHQFFWSKAKRYNNEKLTLKSSDDPTFFRDCLKEIIYNKDQYDTIIVDEAQDFMTAWFDILRLYFLKEDGRLIILGDGEQNIYSREMENGVKMPRINGFGGNDWKSISDRRRQIKRQINPEIVTLASSFANHFNISNEPLIPNSTLNLEDYKIKYYKENQDIPIQILFELLQKILQENNLNYEDTVFLGPSIQILRLLDYLARISGTHTITTFESHEEFQKLKEKHNSNTASLNLDLKAIRRVAKVHFTTDINALKFATIQSFKGWESKNIILLIQKEVEDIRTSQESGFVIQRHEDMNALLYTAITRARENLFILNLGYEKYHEFFNKNIINE